MVLLLTFASQPLSGAHTTCKENLQITVQRIEAGETLGITVLDHIIFNQKGHYSFLEHGEI